MKGITIDLESDYIFGLIGPNGAGKTTLLKVISRQIEPTSGKIIWGGEELTSVKSSEVIHQGITTTYQTPTVIGNLGLIENVMVGSIFKGDFSLGELKEKAEEILELFELEGLKGKPPDKYSLFDKKKLELARAVMSQPKLLLLDEPLAGMRKTEIEQMVDYILSMKEDIEELQKIIIVEHNFRYLMEIVQEMIVLCDGEIISRGKPEMVVAEDEVQRRYFGTSQTS